MSDAYGFSRGNRLAQRFGHWGSQLLITSIVGVIALGFRPATTSPALSLLPFALLLFVVGSWLLMRQHDLHLCEQCASAMPLNPSAQAVRYRRRLALAHSFTNRRLVFSYLGVLVASSIVLSSGPLRPLWALIQASMIYVILSYSTHRRLQPWCPQCRGGGGGGEWADSAPDPVPSNGLTYR